MKIFSPFVPLSLDSSQSYSLNFLQGNAEVSPNRWQIHISQQNPHPMVNHSSKVNVPKQDGISNGAIQTQEHDAVKRNMELTYANSQGNEQVVIVVLSFISSMLGTSWHYISEHIYLSSSKLIEENSAWILSIHWFVTIQLSGLSAIYCFGHCMINFIVFFSYCLSMHDFWWLLCRSIQVCFKRPTYLWQQ